ncbi:hypothetical protein FRC18_010349 [Serendipita sp. 400]|nr:hypothetical protein FRC18_010349 [Serendipita sp. 400]
MSSYVDGLRILSLDGGDIFCTSQLEILREYMHRLTVDNSSASRVCDHFHAIVGVGVAYIRICKAVFSNDSYTSEQRSQALIDVCGDVLGDLKHAELRGDPRFPNYCKVAIGYISPVHLGQCKFLRSYHGKHLSHDVTVSQAIQTTWAMPDFFSPVRIGPPLREEKVISAVNGFNNPTMEVIKEVKDAFGADRAISCLLSLGSGRQRTTIPFIGTNTYAKLTKHILLSSEMTADDAQKRFGRTGVYFRLSVDFDLNEDGAQSDIEQLFGLISAHTASYLLLASPENVLDACIQAAQGGTGIPIELLVQPFSNRNKSSAHGLPPLSPFFVMRHEPLCKMKEGILERMDYEQPVFILSGLGGSGKTQLAIKFARDHVDAFQHILFIDASSTESTEKGLVARLRSVDHKFKGTTVTDVTDALAYPGDELTTRWFLIFDNADDPAMDITDYIPNCDHGVILITTRNPNLGNLSPDNHLPLDVMSKEEAVSALLSSAFGTRETPTVVQRDYAAQIVEQLGYLPVAVIQAGCYIKTQQCFDRYLQRLQANRSSVLRHHSIHKDRLKYKHGVYSAFDTTLQVLSKRALDFLGILSFFHYANVPRQIFSIAASRHFKYQHYDLFEHSDEAFQDSVHLLMDTICPSGKWDEGDLDQLLEELQRYSLVTLISAPRLVTLRFHPLFHSWAGDRLMESERVVLRGAAARLLACVVDREDDILFDCLSSHVVAFLPLYQTLRLNDQAALALIVPNDDNFDLLVQIWTHIHQEVAKIYGGNHIRTNRAALGLANIYGLKGDLEQLEDIGAKVIKSLKNTYESENLELADANINLARLYIRSGWKLEEGEGFIREALRLRRSMQEPVHLDIAEALFELGQVLEKLKRLEEAEVSLKKATEIYTILLGRTKTKTLKAMYVLALCQSKQKKTTGLATLREVVKLSEEVNGYDQPLTISYVKELVSMYCEYELYAQAELLCREQKDRLTQIFGPYNPEALSAGSRLARTLVMQSRSDEASKVLLENVLRRREAIDSDRKLYLEELSWLALEFRIPDQYESSSLKIIATLAEALFEEQEYTEAELFQREEVKARRQIEGVTKNTLGAISSLARIIFEQGEDYAEAEQLYRESITGWKNFDDSDSDAHLKVSNDLFWLGRALHEQGKYTEAEVALRESVQRRTIVQGAYHPATEGARKHLLRATMAPRMSTQGGSKMESSEEKLDLRTDS